MASDLETVERLLTEDLRPSERILLEAMELSEPARNRLNELRRQLELANGEPKEAVALSLMREEMEGLP